MRQTARATVACVLAIALEVSAAGATTINVTPADSYTKIEAATAGDEVVVAPGTYDYRLYLQARGTASAPIIVRAADPQNRPVWDLSSTLVENAPGSYTAGDRGRGCWQFSGAAYIQVSGIIIKGCHNASANSAGVRYYNGSTGITLRDMLFVDNDNGLTGGTQQSDITVEFSEFDSNGNLAASAPSHNIYVYGGLFTLRYSYVHDPIQAQNFHLRATRGLVEYNWFARAKSYQGDLMTSDDYDGSGSLTQSLTFRGNVVIQGNTQSNTSQIIALYNDAGASGLSLNIDAAYNTFIGNGGRAGFVHLSNADGTAMSAQLTNNILFGTTRPAYAEDASGTISGSHNWLMNGADPGDLTASIVGGDPGFTNPSASDYRLATGSSCIGAAETSTSVSVDQEYYQNETVSCAYRERSSASDLGAFESSTTGAGIDAYGTAPQSNPGGTNAAGGSSGAAGNHGATGGSSTAATGDPTTIGTAPNGAEGGCGCRLSASPRNRRSLPFLVFAALGAVVAARRRNRCLIIPSHRVARGSTRFRRSPRPAAR